MTGPEYDDAADDLSPEEHEEIRRLLADARPSGSIPADVAARMDAVLADLAADAYDRPERGSETGPVGSPVVSLAAHRRRRAGGLLVAAAAIVVAGIAVSQHRAGQAGPSADSPTSALDRSATDGSASNSAPEAPLPTGKSPENLAGGSARLQLRKGRVIVHARTFPADATAAKSLLKSYSAQDSSSASSSAASADICTTPPADSEVVRATFERADAVLVYRQPAGDTQVVDLYVCGQSRPVRSVTLPAP